MRASSRQQLPPFVVLIRGATACLCWILVGATLVWGQVTDSSAPAIRTLKGAGPIEYSPSCTGIRLRILKGVERTDYIPRPRPTVPTLQPTRPILRTSVKLPSGGGATNKGSQAERSEGIPLLPIRETQEASLPVAGWGPFAMLSVGQSRCDAAYHEPPLMAKEISSSAPVSLWRVDTAGSSAACTSSIQSTKQKEAVEPATPTLPAPPSATTRREVADGSTRNALYDIAVVQVIATVSASLMVSLAIILSVFVLLRRLRVELPAFVRVETPLPETTQVEPPLEREVGTDIPLAETFDLGLTYEEERRLKEEADLQHEQAVLRTIFEDNIRLRQQLREVEMAAA